MAFIAAGVALFEAVEAGVAAVEAVETVSAVMEAAEAAAELEETWAAMEMGDAAAATTEEMVSAQFEFDGFQMSLEQELAQQQAFLEAEVAVADAETAYLETLGESELTHFTTVQQENTFAQGAAMLAATAAVAYFEIEDPYPMATNLDHITPVPPGRNPGHPTTGEIFPGAPQLPPSLSPHFFNLKRAIFPPLMALNAQVFPRKITKTLRWSGASGQITVPAGGTVGTGALKANSIIDVGQSATPTDVHEPLGFIQMQAMYEQYVVKKATIRWDYFNSHPDGNANPDACVLGISLKDDPTALTVAGHYQELGSTIWHIVPPEGSGKLVYEVFPPKFFGVSVKNASTDSTLKALTTGPVSVSEPDNLLYFHLWAHAARNPDLQFIVHGHVTIDYEIEFFEPKVITQAAYTPA